MKKMKILLLVIFSSVISYAQISNESQLLLSRTFRYLQTQDFLLNNIKEEFPQYVNAIELAEFNFTNKYESAIKNIENDTKKMFGNKYNSCLAQLKKENTKDYKSLKLTEKEALAYINNINDRATLSSIESPVLETMLKYQYLNNPIEEYLRNHVNIHSVTSLSKSDKFELKVSIPISWKEINGNSPSILKKFRSGYATGNEVITISKIELIFKSSFSKNELRKVVPPKAQILGLHLNTINSNKTGVVHFEETNVVSDVKLKQQTVKYIMDTGNRFLQIEFTFHNSINGSTESLSARFKKLNPLFQAITKSININENLSASSLTYDDN